MMIKPTFGERLKIVREEYGISQSQLARKIGMTRAAISLLENGKSSDPILSTAMKIITAFNMSLEEFMQGRDFYDVSDKYTASAIFAMEWGNINRLMPEDRIIIRDLINRLLLLKGERGGYERK